jgi:hypothetical protein
MIKLGLGTQIIVKPLGEGTPFTPIDSPSIVHWYTADSNITFGSTPDRAIRVPDLIGNHDFIDLNPTLGLTYVSTDVDLGNLPVLETAGNTVFSADSSAGDAATGWNIPLPFTITLLVKLAYNPTFSELFRDSRGNGNCVQIIRNASNPTSASNNKMNASGSNSLELNGTGPLNINYNSDTGLVLAIGETTPYQMLTFEFASDFQKFYRNGTLIATSGAIGTPRTFDGSQIRFGAGNPAIRFAELIVSNTVLSDDDRDDLKTYFNNKYSLSI